MTTLPRFFAALLLAVAATGALAQAPVVPTTPNTGLPVVDLTISMYKVKAGVTTASQTCKTGLMFRKTMPGTAGMLFVFDRSAGHCFWMRNTDLSPSIAFIINDDTISDIAEVKSQTKGNHYPTQASSYALEMNKDWLTHKGVKPGMRVNGLSC